MPLYKIEPPLFAQGTIDPSSFTLDEERISRLNPIVDFSTEIDRLRNNSLVFKDIAAEALLDFFDHTLLLFFVHLYDGLHYPTLVS